MDEKRTYHYCYYRGYYFLSDEGTLEPFDSLYELDNYVKKIHAFSVKDSREGAWAKLGMSFGETPKEYDLAEQNDAHVSMWRFWDDVIDAKRAQEENEIANAYMDIAVANLGNRANSI